MPKINILNKLDPDILDKFQAEDIFQDDTERINSKNELIDDDEIKDPKQKEDIKNLITKNSELNEITRQVSKTRVPLANEFSFPDDRESYSFVDLVRKSNALADFQRNLFNTKF